MEFATRVQNPGRSCSCSRYWEKDKYIFSTRQTLGRY